MVLDLNALQLSEIYLQTGYFEYCEPNFGYPEGCLFNYTPNDTHTQTMGD